MAIRLVITVIGCLLLGVGVNGYHTGAPDQNNGNNACSSMNPVAGHGASTEALASSPFEVKTNQNCYKAGQPLQVYIRSKSGQNAEIEGIFVQARASASGAAIGTFTLSNSKLKHAKCNDVATSAVTQTDELDVEFVDMMWNPPAGQSGAVKFYATVVKKQTQYYVKMPSSDLVYSSNCVGAAQVASAATQRATFITVAVGIITAVVILIKQ